MGLAINDFTVLLSRQHANPRDVLMFNMLAVVVVVIAVGPDEVGTQGAL